MILAASTLENTRLLLLSEKGGLANSSGLLGHYMMDQVGGGGVSGILPKLRGGPARLDDGKQAGITIPNFQNIDAKTQRPIERLRAVQQLHAHGLEARLATATPAYKG